MKLAITYYSTVHYCEKDVIFDGEPEKSRFSGSGVPKNEICTQHNVPVTALRDCMRPEVSV